MTYIIGEESKVSHGSFARQLADKIIVELGRTFPKITERLSVWDETEKYNWKEDESVWKQKKGLAPGEGECYFDRQFISAYLQRDGVTNAYVRFLSGLSEKYKNGEIFVHPEIYMIKAEEAKLKAEKDALEVPEARNEGEQMVSDIIVEHAKKRRRKVKIVK